MVKRQKEKQYESSREHRANSALRAGNTTSGSTTVRKLPFQCCALSLMPFETPVCTRMGIVFDKTSLENFWKETGSTAATKKLDPVTGDTLATNDLIALTMDRDDEGRWQCPIMTKPFADHTKIVAIIQPHTTATEMKEANVYSYEAYHELNVKAKNYHDLISGQKFHKTKDVIILNDPEDMTQEKRRDINTFYHIQNQRQLEALKNKNTAAGGGNTNIRHSVTATRILDKIQTKTNSDNAAKKRSNDTTDLQKEGKRLKVFSDEVTGVKFTGGKGSGSFTSTSMTVSHDTAAREATQEEIDTSLFAVLRKQKRKGYVKLQTTVGDVLLEIHCDYVPRTATNFIKLCCDKQYNGSQFHRLIPHFMIQGGKKPTSDDNNDKKGGKKGGKKDDGDDCSIWGGAFQDEFHEKLKHDAPGILSMANAGPNTNRRQFFLTFQPCEHLNKKHSVFGVVIEGMDVLKAMEKIPVDKKDRPKQDVIILDTVVVDNPVEDAEEIERKRIEKWRKQQQKGSTQKSGKEHDDKKMAAKTDTASNQTTSTVKPQIGRYLPKVGAAAVAAMPEATKNSNDEGAVSQLKPAATKPKPKAKMKFGNFSAW